MESCYFRGAHSCLPELQCNRSRDMATIGNLWTQPGFGITTEVAHVFTLRFLSNSSHRQRLASRRHYLCLPLLAGKCTFIPSQIPVLLLHLPTVDLWKQSTQPPTRRSARDGSCRFGGNGACGLQPSPRSKAPTSP